MGVALGDTYVGPELTGSDQNPTHAPKPQLEVMAQVTGSDHGRAWNQSTLFFCRKNKK